MTLQQLKYIVAIVDSGSINSAAATLFISQPSLSSAVRSLEKELGFSIFLRSNRGAVLSTEGEEFLGYARQVLEQADLLEQRYFRAGGRRRLFAVSTQHYAFSVNAFVNLIENYGQNEYEFTLRETKTHEIIEDVYNLRSEVGVLYRSEFNQGIMGKIWREKDLEFTPLFTAAPHVFLCARHPLAQQKQIKLQELDPYPCLSFEQGTHNSFYFSEEIYSTQYHPKSILVSDRATIFNLIIGLNGYTISTGILSEDLNGKDICSVPLVTDIPIEVGYLCKKDVKLSLLALSYIDHLKHYIEMYQQKNT